MHYFVRIRGKAFGPFDDEKLISMKAQGKLSKTTEVSENQVDWVLAESLDFLYPQSNTVGQSTNVSSAVSTNNEPHSPQKQADWYYSVNGTEGFGPVTQSAIVRMLQDGTLHRESVAWQEGQNAEPLWAIACFERYVPNQTKQISSQADYTPNQERQASPTNTSVFAKSSTDPSKIDYERSKRYFCPAAIGWLPITFAIIGVFLLWTVLSGGSHTFSRLARDKENAITSFAQNKGDAIARFEQDKDSALARLARDRDDAIARLSRDRDDAVARLDRTKNNAIAQLERIRDTAIARLENDSDKESVLAKFENDRDSAIAKFENDRDSAIAKFAKDRDDTVARLERTRDTAIAEATKTRDDAITRLEYEQDDTIARIKNEKDRAMVHFFTMFLLGLVAVVPAGFLIFKTLKENRITDEEIDQICADYVTHNLKSMALKKLGIEEDQVQEIEPIQFHDYYYGNLSSDRSGILNVKDWAKAIHSMQFKSSVKFKMGRDRLCRPSNYNGIIFFFSTDQVYSYAFRFSLLGEERQELTSDCFYGDIVDISTVSDTVIYGATTFIEGIINAILGTALVTMIKKFFGIRVKSETVHFEEFKLTTSGGTSAGATVSDLVSSERSIQGMKNLVRDKKLQSQQAPSPESV